MRPEIYVTQYRITIEIYSRIFNITVKSQSLLHLGVVVTRKGKSFNATQWYSNISAFSCKKEGVLKCIHV